MKAAESKWIHGPFEEFFERPTREHLRALLKQSGGEFAEFDFKEQWLERSELARHTLAFANSGGGCLIVGVAEVEGALEPKGLTGLQDKTKVIDGIVKYIAAPLVPRVRILDFNYTDAENAKLAGKTFQVFFVEGDDAELPYLSMAEGANIKKDRVYIRRGPSTTEATADELNALIARRISSATGGKDAGDLSEHLAELKVLFTHVPKSRMNSGIFGAFSQGMMDSILGVSEPNPNYPKEDFELFVLRLIAEKKQLIRRNLGLNLSS